MELRRAGRKDLECLLQLYTQLHGEETPQIDAKMVEIWTNILNDKNHYIIVGETENKIISSCVLIIVPNLTHNQRPYALIENVITDGVNRGKGYATRVLSYAKDIAIEHNCYKIMLLTGSKQESTLSFYKRAGYNCNDKTAFIQWL